MERGSRTSRASQQRATLNKVLAICFGIVAIMAASFALVPRAHGEQPVWTLPRPVPLDFNGSGTIALQDISDYDFVLAGGEIATAASLDINGDEVTDDRDRASLIEGYYGGVTDEQLLGLNTKPRGRSTVAYVPADGQECPSGFTCFESIAAATRSGAKMILVGGGTHVSEYIGGGWQRDTLTMGGTSEEPLIIAADPAARTRPVLQLPANVTAGLRTTDDVRFVTVRGLHLVCSRGQSGVVISGTSSDIRVVDCIIDGGPGGEMQADGGGGATGVLIQGYGPTAPGSNGIDKRPTRIVIAYTLVYGQNFGTASGPHTQGLYAANFGELSIYNNVFWRCGKRGSMYDQAIYLVHGELTRPVVIGNFIGEPGSACIQMRGTEFGVIGWNVCFWYNTGIGLGHRFGWRDGVWSNVIAHNNLMADPREDGSAPAKWGMSHMAGRTNQMLHNVLRGHAEANAVVGQLGPFAIMTAQDQGGGAADVPVGEFVLRGTNASSERSGAEWTGELAKRLAREHGQWNENVHGTRQLIESVRARTPSLN